MAARTYITWLLIAGALGAQQVVAPTASQVGPPLGENVGNYNITDSFETGYRWSLIGGDLGMYRSDVNYRNGLRVLGSNLTVNSKDGHGHYFDEIVLNTIGLGNDPYQAATLRVQKNKLYRYDLLWRLDEFYNPGLVISGGEHLMDTRRRMQDHELVLLPQSAVQFDLGYSRNTQTGPALSSVQGFDTLSTAFPVFDNVHRQWNEYRLAVTANLHGFRFIVRRTWDFFKEDSAYSLTTPEAAGLANDATVLQNFQRVEPYHGSNGGWLGNFYGNRKRWAINARMTYVSGNGDFALNEQALGVDRFGAAANRQILVDGDAQRPVLAADFHVSLFPTDRLTIVNNTGIHNTRIDGDSYYTEFDNALGTGTTLQFHFLGVRTIANETDLNYRVSKWLAVYAGYTNSDRQIRLLDAFAIPGVAGSAANDLYQQDSHLSAGNLGVRLHPIKPLTFSFEGEVGHASHPLATMTDRNYHTANGRADYRLRNLQLSAAWREVYNYNAPLSFLTYSSRTRQASASASWSPKTWFTIDASYVKLHLDTVGGLAFFAGVNNPQLQTSFDSIYISNIHSGNLAVRLAFRRRIDLYLGYSITKDTGDGRSTPVPAGVTNPVESLLDSVQTFPLTFQSPLARLSIRITPKLRWNAGYQFYGYSEQFHLLGYDQNYNAHTGFTSLLWSF